MSLRAKMFVSASILLAAQQAASADYPWGDARFTVSCDDYVITQYGSYTWGTSLSVDIDAGKFMHHYSFSGFEGGVAYDIHSVDADRITLVDQELALETGESGYRREALVWIEETIQDTVLDRFYYKQEAITDTGKTTELFACDFKEFVPLP